MPGLRKQVLALAQDIGDRSGCHQMPERCFKIRGYTFPVCARCSGVVAGEILALLMLIPAVVCPWYIAAAMLAVMGLDWLEQKTGILQSTNARRFVTGILGGCGLFSIYFFIIITVYNLIAGLF